MQPRRALRIGLRARVQFRYLSCGCLCLHRMPPAAGRCAGGLAKQQHGVVRRHHRSLLCSRQSCRMRAVLLQPLCDHCSMQRRVACYHRWHLCLKSKVILMLVRERERRQQPPVGEGGRKQIQKKKWPQCSEWRSGSGGSSRNHCCRSTSTPPRKAGDNTCNSKQHHRQKASCPRTKYPRLTPHESLEVRFTSL